MATTPDLPLPPDAEGIAPGPMHAALDHAREAGAEAAQRLKDGVASAHATMVDGLDEVCEIAQQRADEVRDNVRAQPLLAITAAFAVGLLIGKLCR